MRILVFREYPIRTDVDYHQNKFQAYRFKPLSQFSFFYFFSFFFNILNLSNPYLYQYINYLLASGTLARTPPITNLTSLAIKGINTFSCPPTPKILSAITDEPAKPIP